MWNKKKKKRKKKDDFAGNFGDAIIIIKYVCKQITQGRSHIVKQGGKLIGPSRSKMNQIPRHLQ